MFKEVLTYVTCITFLQRNNGIINKVPLSITNGDYRLKIEGYHADQSKKVLFVKQSLLTFHPEFLAILVQTNRKVYCNNMNGIYIYIYLFSFLFSIAFCPYIIIYFTDPPFFISQIQSDCYGNGCETPQRSSDYLYFSNILHNMF